MKSRNEKKERISVKELEKRNGKVSDYFSMSELTGDLEQPSK